MDIEDRAGLATVAAVQIILCLKQTIIERNIKYSDLRTDKNVIIFSTFN